MKTKIHIKENGISERTSQMGKELWYSSILDQSIMVILKMVKCMATDKCFMAKQNQETIMREASLKENDPEMEYTTSKMKAK
jgi:hypothetical protein